MNPRFSFGRGCRRRGPVLALLALVVALGCGNWRLQTDGVAPVGDEVVALAPAFSLANDDGTFVTLDELLADGRPTVVLFYRGHW